MQPNDTQVPKQNESSDRELDAAVAEKIFGEKRHDLRWIADRGAYFCSGCPAATTRHLERSEIGCCGEGRSVEIWDSKIPHYSTDDNAARLVRDKIAELGLVAQYRQYLAMQVWPKNMPFYQFKGADEFAFRFEQATPRQQCLAALRALEDRCDK